MSLKTSNCSNHSNYKSASITSSVSQKPSPTLHSEVHTFLKEKCKVSLPTILALLAGFWETPCNAQGFLLCTQKSYLAGLRTPCSMLRTEPESVMNMASTLPTFPITLVPPLAVYTRPIFKLYHLALYRTNLTSH